MYELMISVNGIGVLWLHFEDYEAMVFFAETVIENNCSDDRVSFTIQKVED